MESDWDFVHLNEVKDKIQLSDRWYQLVLDMMKLAGLNLSKPDTKFLEVGCGLGGFSVWANKKCEDATGLDIAKTRINMANKLRKRLGREVGFMTGDAQSLPFRDGSYNVVVCSEVLEHLPDYRKAFDELVRVTKNSGYIIITVPNYINMTRLYMPLDFPSYLTGRRPQPDDLNRFNIFVINRLFERKDLRVIVKRGVGLIHIRSVNPKIKFIENRLNRSFDRLKFLCINIGVIAQKISE
jgi:SAM-dependent methyltransferase